ncbi:hypothetical protein T07_3469 [Trichinella nelsoni]|uniref:Uncharacterized protein n=1 Tax=Trichinella nelsoni TaxID=6336 RepID=A0A0V0SGU3_9BILA|nr:hypothetical protein T07_3469 [Trichinella nelsoni]
MGAQLLNFLHESSMYNCLTYVTCSFDNDHNQNMLKQPLHLVICLPLRTAVSGSFHIRLFKKFRNSFMSHAITVKTEFKEALRFIQASFAIRISKYKFNE